MTTPWIEVDLSKIRHNTRYLVERLKARGITVTAVTKAVCGILKSLKPCSKVAQLILVRRA